MLSRCIYPFVDWKINTASHCGYLPGHGSALCPLRQDINHQRAIKVYPPRNQLLPWRFPRARNMSRCLPLAVYLVQAATGFTQLICLTDCVYWWDVIYIVVDCVLHVVSMILLFLFNVDVLFGDMGLEIGLDPWKISRLHIALS